MEEPTTIWSALGSVASDVLAGIPEGVLTFAPVFGALALIGIGLGIARKFGVRR